MCGSSTIKCGRGDGSRWRDSWAVRQLDTQFSAGIRVWILALVSLSIQLAEIAIEAGDRVIFSTATNSIESPSNRGKEDILKGSGQAVTSRSAPSEFDAMPGPVNTANPIPNRTLQEMLDRHRNWAFMTPETAFVKSPDLDLDPESALAVKDATPKRAVEVYLDNQNQAGRATSGSQQRRTGNVLSSGGTVGSLDPRSELTRSLGIDPSVNNPVSIGLFAPPFERLGSGVPSASALSPMVYPSTTSQTTSESDLNNQLSSAIKPKRPVSPIQDSINLLPDLTSESIQPVIGIRKSDPANDSLIGIDAANLSRNADRSRNQDTLTSRVLGSSSLAPAIAPIDPNRVFTPPPAVLEIPKRRF